MTLKYKIKMVARLAGNHFVIYIEIPVHQGEVMHCY